MVEHSLTAEALVVSNISSRELSVNHPNQAKSQQVELKDIQVYWDSFALWSHPPTPHLPGNQEAAKATTRGKEERP